MKVTGTVLFVAALGLLCAGCPLASPGVAGQSRESLTMEISVKKEKMAHKGLIPVLSARPVGPPWNAADAYMGGWATVDCIKCPLSREYSLFAEAVRVNSDEAEVWIGLEFANKKRCNFHIDAQKVSRDKPLYKKGSCGVEISVKFPTDKTLAK